MTNTIIYGYKDIVWCSDRKKILKLCSSHCLAHGRVDFATLCSVTHTGQSRSYVTLFYYPRYLDYMVSIPTTRPMQQGHRFVLQNCSLLTSPVPNSCDISASFLQGFIPSSIRAGVEARIQVNPFVFCTKNCTYYILWNQWLDLLDTGSSFRTSLSHPTARQMNLTHTSWICHWFPLA